MSESDKAARIGQIRNDVERLKSEVRSGDPLAIRQNVLGNMFTGLLLRVESGLTTEEAARAEIELFNEAASDFRTSLEELQELAEKSRDWLDKE